MRLDMDLVRRILLIVEEEGPKPGGISINLQPDHSSEEVHYHLSKIKEAGLIKAIEMHFRQGSVYQPTELTWEGHMFLDDVRSELLWEKAKKLVLKKAGTLSLEMLKVALKEVAKQVVSD